MATKNAAEPKPYHHGNLKEEFIVKGLEYSQKLYKEKEFGTS